MLAAFLLNVAFNFVIGLLVAKFLGPEEFGRFALALATAVAVQAAFLDWIRLGATRFYSERVRGEDPALRATLDVAFALIIGGLTVGASCLFMTGGHFALSNGLIALAIAMAVANGLFDYNTALVRARFHDKLYVKLVIVKNILALLLTGGGAFYFRSAGMALFGSMLSLGGSVIAARAALSDPGADVRAAKTEVARSIARYAIPIVTANLLYVSIPLANRSLITVLYGFSETGQFSLAYDVGTKAVQAIGSMLDVLLFQIAVRAHDIHGAEHSKQRIADNMSIVLAIILPACLGIWLVLPSAQALVVPEQYRGPLGHFLTLMMPGLFCFALILYALNPIFQIAKRTGPLIVAALVGCIVDALLLLLLPRGEDASTLAIAQSGAFAAAFVTLIGTASFSKPVWPKPRDVVATILASIAMTVAILPLRSWPPGVVTMLAQIVGGVAIYSALVALFDIASLRTLMLDRLTPLIARFRPS